MDNICRKIVTHIVINENMEVSFYSGSQDGWNDLMKDKGMNLAIFEKEVWICPVPQDID